ncbi:hypothetical protein KDX30_27380, partial [Pseudomonas sp. CDFA 553]|uniref:hypothetical protein n=1 Tax=Pseudomonas quasicaspiana TaxID=2829821 RepID=UPI001E5F8EF6
AKNAHLEHLDSAFSPVFALSCRRSLRFHTVCTGALVARDCAALERLVSVDPAANMADMTYALFMMAG